MDHYSPSEFVTNCISFIRTKLFFRQCRFIRFPFYIRGRKSLQGATGLTLGRFCRFELDGKKKTLKIGDNCEMGDLTHIVALSDVTIGNNVLIASKCFISDTSHGIYRGEEQDKPDTHPNKRKVVSKSVKIGNSVWIGENAVVLSGVEIGDGCVIGANSVITKSIPSNCIVVGNNVIVKKYDGERGEWLKI